MLEAEKNFQSNPILRMEIEKEELKEAMNKIINENNELIDFADKMEKKI